MQESDEKFVSCPMPEDTLAGCSLLDESRGTLVLREQIPLAEWR